MMGLPIVTTDIPGCEMVVKNNINGYKEKIKNVDLLIHKLEILMRSRSKRIIFSKNSIKIAKKYFDIRHIINQHSKIYSKVCNG